MSELATTSRTCGSCRLAMPLSQFYRDKRGRDGLKRDCIACSKAGALARTAKKREEMGEEAWLEQHRNRVRAARSKPEVRERDREQARAWSAAVRRLREAHPKEFQRYYELERYERGLA